MVRKVSILLACVCLLFCVSRSAHAATPQFSNIPSQVLEIAKGVIAKHPINTDYILYPWDDDVYLLTLGDLEYDETMFQFYLAGDTVTYGLMRANEGYNSGYQLFATDTDTIIDVSGGQIVYSNLGLYPSLIERGTMYEMQIAFTLVVGLLLLFILRIFSRR